MSGLHLLEIALPKVDEHPLRLLGSVSPQLAGLEGDAVERLGTAAPPMRVRVRQNVDAVDGMDAPAVTAGVARQARVARRLPVAREDGVARLEARRRRGLALLGHAFAHHVHDAVE